MDNNGRYNFTVQEVDEMLQHAERQELRIRMLEEALRRVVRANFKSQAIQIAEDALNRECHRVRKSE